MCKRVGRFGSTFQDGTASPPFPHYVDDVHSEIGEVSLFTRTSYPGSKGARREARMAEIRS